MKWRALHWYASLFRLAGTSLQEATGRAGLPYGDSIQQWVETPQLRYDRLPRGFRAVETWLIARPHDPTISEVLSQPRVQARLGALYQGYRADKRKQRARYDDVHVARELSDVMRGRRKASSQVVQELAAALGAWRKAPTRHALATTVLHALLPMLAAWVAYRHELPGGGRPKTPKPR